MTINRREDFRVPDRRLITEFVKDRPFVSSIINLSNSGMLTLKSAGGSVGLPRQVQLQIDVPEANEIIWASGEVVFSRPDVRGFGTGIRFKNMARSHKSILADLVEDRRRKVLRSLLEDILWRKEFGQYAMPLAAPAPAPREHTVPMYRLPRPL